MYIYMYEGKWGASEGKGKERSKGHMTSFDTLVDEILHTPLTGK